MHTTIADLIGQTLTDVIATDEDIQFVTSEGKRFLMHHMQNCCEDVHVDDIDGELSDLVGAPILIAEEVSNHDELLKQMDPTDLAAKENFDFSVTWTFYKIDTAKGGVTIRWIGASNGWYSEAVDFIRVD